MLRLRLPLLGPRWWIPAGVVYILVLTLVCFFFLLSAGFVLCRAVTSCPLPGLAFAVLVSLVQDQCPFLSSSFFYVSICEDFVDFVYAGRDRDNVPVDW